MFLGKLPKNYNPEVDPDPERWLPRRERSYYKGKRQKKTAVGKYIHGNRYNKVYDCMMDCSLRWREGAWPHKDHPYYFFFVGVPLNSQEARKARYPEETLGAQEKTEVPRNSTYIKQ